MANLSKIHVVHTITIKYCPVVSDSFVLFHSFAVTFPLDNWNFLDVFHFSGLISYSERQWDKGQEHGESISIVKVCFCSNCWKLLLFLGAARLLSSLVGFENFHHLLASRGPLGWVFEGGKTGRKKGSVRPCGERLF